nr:hypothetical protein Iba_chr12fCG10570 [Ipomoea batatas]
MPSNLYADVDVFSEAEATPSKLKTNRSEILTSCRIPLSPSISFSVAVAPCSIMRKNIDGDVGVKYLLCSREGHIVKTNEGNKSTRSAAGEGGGDTVVEEETTLEEEATSWMRRRRWRRRRRHHGLEGDVMDEEALLEKEEATPLLRRRRCWKRRRRRG